MLISAVQQSDSIVHMYFFHILFHYYLSQDIEYSCGCYTVGHCCLSILYIILFASANPKLSIHFSPTSTPTWQPQVCFLCPQIILHPNARMVFSEQKLMSLPCLKPHIGFLSNLQSKLSGRPQVPRAPLLQTFPLLPCILVLICPSPAWLPRWR